MTSYTGTLTDQQLRDAITLRDSWMSVGLSTARCDRAAAQQAVQLAYEAAGLPKPPLMVWMDSPLGGLFATAVIHGRLGGRLRDQLGDRLGDQLGDQLRDRLHDQLDDQLDDQLGGRLRGRLDGRLGDQLGGRLHGQLRDQLGDRLRDRLGDQLRGQLDPWYEAYWLSFYSLALDIAGLEPSHRLESLGAAVWHTGWWWPLRGAVVLTDRPTVLLRDQQARLHGETGPALAYRDSYALYAWHGTRVPADLVTGNGWPTDRILREPNAEIRRCAIERTGWDRFVVDAGLAQVGPAEPDPGNPGRDLALFDVPAAIYDEPVRVLICRNGSADRDGTRRTFGLTVPADVPDPTSAAAWTYGVGRGEYAALARRT